MNKNFESLIALVPAAGESAVGWDKARISGLYPYFQRMGETPQNPEWHGEGDVFSHTKMVCDYLVKTEVWQGLERRRQEEVFIAALLHDIGKIVSTRTEDGVLVSPNHSSIGERMARTILWKDFGLCGTYEAQQFRETVCALIRNHSVPFHFYDNESPGYTAIKAAAIGELTPDFSNELLSLLVEADINGRIASNINERLEHLYFFREISSEAGCLGKPFEFPSPFSRYAYLSGRNVVPGQRLYDDTWGTVVLLSGLPGTGKDTYIKRVYPDLPVVSLDSIRKETGTSPKAPQGGVISAAYQQARAYLRKKQPFIWNATNLTPALRQRIIGVITDYKASAKIVFLETRWDELQKRNNNRADPVPESVIEDLLAKLVPPNLSEAHEVEWIIS